MSCSNATTDTEAFRSYLRVYSPVWFPFPPDASAVSTVTACAALLSLNQPIQLHSWSSAHGEKSLSNVSIWCSDTGIQESPLMRTADVSVSLLPSQVHHFALLLAPVFLLLCIQHWIIPKTTQQKTCSSVKTLDQPQRGARRRMH